MKFLRIRKEVGEAEMIPSWYGVAWTEPWKRGNSAVCYPIPLNFIMGWGLLLLMVLKRGPNKLIRNVYNWLERD